MVFMRPKLLTLIAVPVFALVGCTASATPEPAPVESSTPSASPAPAAKKAVAKKVAEETQEDSKKHLEEAFLKEYRFSGGAQLDYTDKELVGFGKEACELLGKTGEVPAEFIGHSTGEQGVGVAATMAAKVVLCPEFNSYDK